MRSLHFDRDRDPGTGHRAGKVLVLLALLLPTLFATLAYFIDSSMLLLEFRRSQHLTDAAATAAALNLWTEKSNPQTSADRMVEESSDDAALHVVARTPPQTGPYAGRAGFVEVGLTQPYDGYFLTVAGWNDDAVVHTRAVAGVEPTTAPAGIVILDPDPAPITLGPLPVSLPSLTPLLGGLEVLGLGELSVEGAILVNTTWGGYDEDGTEVGEPSPVKAACSCTPLLSLTRVRADDIRVAGGVDNPDHYRAHDDNAESPLRANRRPVPDPLAHLPVPTLQSDPNNVSATEYGGVRVANLPLIQPPHVFEPGVYDWIEVIGGRVIFEPGVYIIRGVNPATGIGLNILTGHVSAEGVMFYLTNTTAYSPASGLPDSLDGETPAPAPSASTQMPSAIIDVGLLNSNFTPLTDSQSPFNGMLIYQRRHDRRPILIVQQNFLLHSAFTGTVYGKWAHLLIAIEGTFHTEFVVGSLRSLTFLETRIDPLRHLPPAHDVYLVE